MAGGCYVEHNTQCLLGDHANKFYISFVGFWDCGYTLAQLFTRCLFGRKVIGVLWQRAFDHDHRSLLLPMSEMAYFCSSNCALDQQTRFHLIAYTAHVLRVKNVDLDCIEVSEEAFIPIP